MSKKYSRKEFIKTLGASCAGMGATTLLSSVANLGLISSAAASNMKNMSYQQAANEEYKALVCIVLAGGNDSFNMLVPRGDSEYGEYATTRGTLAVPQEDLLPINPLNATGKEFGLHPSMSKVKAMFDEGDVAFLANVGTLVQPTTVTEFNNGSSTPRGLFSHSDQEQQWQTSIPDDRNAATGWGGRMGDILQDVNGNENISMNISLGGDQFGVGNNVNPYPISSEGDGAVLLDGSTSNSFYETLKRSTFDNLLDETYSNTLQKAYANTVKNSVNNSFEFSAAISGVEEFTSEFEEWGGLGPNLEIIAKTIGARNTLDFKKQTFISRTRGWDHHTDVIEGHAGKLEELDSSLAAFYGALKELGMENNVTTFIVSDFGRTLTSNGAGSDHAWGGNVMVMGGSVNGQRIFGDYPDLHLGSERDLGRGRFIPTTSTDEYFAELALWFGASSSDLKEILPNIDRFWTPTADSYPIGFMS